MREDAKKADRIERAVVEALEVRPEVTVPADFAAYVARSLPSKTTDRAAIRPVFGRTAGYLAAVAMMAVLMVLARMHPEALETGRGFLFDLELMLVAQLLAVGLWLGTRNDELN